MEAVLSFARHEFRLSAPRRQGGGTLREHLRAVQRQTGKAPAGLLGPPKPPGAALLWRAFLDLHGGRASDMGSPQPIAWRDIAAWQDATGERLRRAELDLIRALDHEFRAAHAAAGSGPAADADDDWSRD